MTTKTVTLESLEGRYQDFCENLTKIAQRTHWYKGCDSAFAFKHKRASANSDGEYYDGGR